MRTLYFIILLIFIFSLSSCSRKSDVELFTEGKAAEEQRNFDDAVKRYEEVISRFESSAYAESSLYRLSFMYNNELKDIQKAVKSYRRFYEMFPTSEHAPTMLFLTGFLYNNNLHMLDSARVVYEAFLKRYPEHELAPSAMFELKTLGKDPTQALNKQITSTNENPSKSINEAPR